MKNVGGVFAFLHAFVVPKSQPLAHRPLKGYNNYTMTKTVALAKCATYDNQAVYEALQSAMSQVPPPDVQGKTVLLKPNILTPKKVEAAVCTNPVVVAVAIRLFLERGAKRVLVGESPATHNSTQAAKGIGMYDAVVQAGGEWADFSGQTIVNNPQGKLVKNFEFAAPFAEADLVVSIAKLKTHQLMVYTGAMKNLFGLMVGLKKAQSHFRFAERKEFSKFLTDLVIAANPGYAIMDAIIGMEGPGGPGSGDPVQLGFLAASDNILALDWICSSIVGYRPHLIENLKDAMERGLWLKNAEEISTVGATPTELKPESFRIVKETSVNMELSKHIPKWLYRFIELLMIKTPRFIHKKCIQCGKCVEICPAQVLTLEKKIHIEKSGCVHCFCCHEICPADAIKLKRL